MQVEEVRATIFLEPYILFVDVLLNIGFNILSSHILSSSHILYLFANSFEQSTDEGDIDIEIHI